MRALNILITIGQYVIDHKGIKSLSIDRNFADIANTFELSLMDSEQVSQADLELYMNSGFRNIKISYFDSSDMKNILSFDGSIWDYTTTLVGSIKELKLTGNISKNIVSHVLGEARYNIDFNNYYNLRVYEDSMWGALARAQYLYETIIPDNTETLESGEVFYRSPASIANALSNVNENAVKIEIIGPSKKSIYLPVPDSFVPFVESTSEVTEDVSEAYFTSGDDLEDGPWGRLIKKEITHTENPNFAFTYWLEFNESNALRAFSSPYLGGETYLQANPSSEYYGAGTFLYDGMGVRPSEIVKKLAILEGWDIGHIVDTEYVACSEAYKMQNRTALQFIQEVLVPVSITPTGTYTLAEGYYDSYTDTTYEAGARVTFTKGFSGFVPYFKDNKFYYEPLNSELLKVTHDFNYNYNGKNSQVLSFQVNTKGTAFYTEQPVVMNTLSIVTGKEYKEIKTLSPTVADDYNKVDIHNENLDNFFGFTYEEVESNVRDIDGSSFSSTNTETWFKNILNVDSINIRPESSSDNAMTKIISSIEAINNNFVTIIPQSSVVSSSELNSALTGAYERIKQFAITASMSIYGNVKIAPGDYININILLDRVTSGTNIHPASGKYLILSQQDQIGQSGFTQTLSLFRATDLDAQISPQKVDWSKDITNEKTAIVDNR